MRGSLLEFLVSLAPLLLLVVLLLFGRYPGERSIARARRAVDRVLARPVASAAPALPLSDLLGTVRGGRLLAHSLAGRGPPFAG